MSMNTPAGYQEPAGAWVAQFVKRHFGRVTTNVESFPTIGTSAAQILKPNPRRFGWLIFNLSSGNVFFSFNTAPSTVAGFPVQPLGGGVSAQADEDGELTTVGVSAIGSMSGSQLYVLEVMGV